MNRFDDFNRANTPDAIGTPSDGGSDYMSIGVGSWGIDLEQACDSDLTTGAVKACVLECGTPNAEVKVTLAAAPNDVRLVLRCNPGGDYLLCRYSVTLQLIEIGKWIGEVYTMLAQYFGLVPAGTIAKLSVDSSNLITAYQDDIVRVSTTDSEGATNTLHGIGTYSAQFNARFDDLSIMSLEMGPQGDVGPQRTSRPSQRSVTQQQ